MPQNKCQICGVEALPGQTFTRDGVPFFQRYRCPNCHTHLTKHFLQGLFFVNVGLGLLGLILVANNPRSETGQTLLNLFWFIAFSYLCILPHELAHAWAGKLAGFRIVDVSMGSGATLFTIRGLTFPVRVKAIPFGGFTFGQPIRVDHLRFRLLVFVAAGPAVNLLIAAVFWLVTGEGPSLTTTSAVTNVFVMANLLTVVENLIPFSFTSPEYGRLQSDGLSLLRLIFAHKLPLIPKADVSTEPGKTSRNFFQVAGALFLLLLGFACAAMASWVAIHVGNESALWYAVLVFALISLSLGWLSWRVWSRKPELPTPPHSYDSLLAIYMAEMTDLGSATSRGKISVLNKEVARLVTEQNLEAALQRTDEALAEFPTNLFLLSAKTTLLTGQKRNAEAYNVFSSILAQAGLRSETRTVVAIEALKSLARDGQIDKFHAELDSLVETAATVIEKVFVLDAVASLPVYERFPHLVSAALQWCEQALALQPGNLTVRATQACLLFEAGNLQPSEQQLKEIYALSESPVDKALTSFYLALICKSRQERKAAFGLARRAIRHHQLPELATRFTEEFPDLRRGL